MTKREFIARFGHVRVSLYQGMRRNQGADILAKRASVALYLRTVAEGGMVALVENGMDCDCVSYTGLVREVPANVIALERAMARAYDNAEGAIQLYVMRPSQAAEIEYGTRDRAAEAYENGHAHVVYA